MEAQGFKPYSDSITVMSSLPEGRRMAWVTLGEFSEPDAYDTGLWTDDDYQAHWAETAERCLGGELPTVFCMNYSEEGCTCLSVWATADGYVMTQQILVPLSDLALKGKRLVMANMPARPFPRASQWAITKQEMAHIAKG